MKISFLGCSVGYGFEGKTKIALKIMDFLKQKGFDVVLDAKDADVFHVHSSGFYESFTLDKIKKRTKAQCIYSLYSTGISDFFGYLRNYNEERKYRSRGERGNFNFFYGLTSTMPLKFRAFKLRNFDHVIVPSEWVKNQLFDDTQVIHMGIDTTRFRKIKNSAERDSLNVSYMGHLSAFKGITDYILASRKAEGCKFNIYFTLVRKATKDKIKKMNPQLNLFGHKSNMESIYNDSDIVVLPYRNTLGAIANPLVLLEAMACERAVITTRVPNIEEITGNAAELVDPYSPNQLVNAIEKLRDEKKRQILGKKARERVLKEYDEKKMLNQYLKLYEDISKKI